MSDDDKALVERLRWGGWYFDNPYDGNAYASDDPLYAADHIEAQAAEIERLREALTKISLRKWNSMTQGCNAAREANDIARAALAGKAEQ